MVETSPPATAIKRGKAPKRAEIKLSPKEQIAAQLKKRLKPIAGVEAALFEDLGELINVYIETNNVRNATLYPVFDAQYDLESEYAQKTFHFFVNPVDWERLQTSNQIQRLF